MATAYGSRTRAEACRVGAGTKANPPSGPDGGARVAKTAAVKATG